MASYVITGASRGLGYEFLRQLSADAKNTVIGLVRDKPGTDKKVAEDAELKGRTNIHVLQADMTDYDALKKAAEDTAEITGGSLDYIIANAALISKLDAYTPIGALAAAKPKELEEEMLLLTRISVVGNTFLFTLFMPLILKGRAKKIIALSTGLADLELTNKYDLELGALYSASKAAMNMIVAKFSAQYKSDGVLFLSISPGMVDTGVYDNVSDEDMVSVNKMVTKFMAYAPGFKGPITPEESARMCRSVWENASVEGGSGGDFVSHYGNKTWLE